MALPVNIAELIHGHTVEWARIELKKGWNAKKVLHTMCAFANDIHNWGGGYIIVGVEEFNGQAKLPPEGIEQKTIDGIQKELLQLSHRIAPNYFPIVEPSFFDGQHILIIWCPAGDNRPYSAPASIEKGAYRNYYVRINSNTVIAPEGSTEYNQLLELAARIPFDDRVNNQASINDLDLGLIREYLQEIKSGLLEDSAKMPFADLCRTMHIAKGPAEDIRPVNAGLLFFSKEPHQFFQRAWIELVIHKDNSGRHFNERYFKGPLHKQLRETLSYLKNNLIAQQIIKYANKAESDRFYNYPFEAIEEALSNAVYHKSYESNAPIEVQVFPDRITILSHPGPVPPVNAKTFANQKQIIAREYRNRRIGDFLKELHLTEGRGTGFPTIYSAMTDNGSPSPVFETDDATYVLVTLLIHDSFKDTVSDEVSDQVNMLVIKSLDDIIAISKQESDGAIDGAIDGARNEVSNIMKDILEAELHTKVEGLLEGAKMWITRSDLFAKISLYNNSTNREKYLDPLIDNGWIEMEYPDNPTHPKQRYRNTNQGMRILKLINVK
jgi:ATP-dependent DNA helicase RecG